MTAYHHLYPFRPWGLHGGTLRLRTAIAASLLDGTAMLSWWDGTRSAWQSDLPIERVGGADPERLATLGDTKATRLKRWIFPFTLWEAGRKPRSFVDHVLNMWPDATLVLHTTLLAPLAAELRRSGRHVVIDVHDVMFRGHLEDAEGASITMQAVRRSYARTVRGRERSALKFGHRLAVAGWDDARLLADLGLVRGTWAPTGLEAQLSMTPDNDLLRVGLVGNFHHSMTARTASELVASPLGSDPTVQIVVAGTGSERYETFANVLSLGPIADIGEFYDRIHATVAPVTNGTGMKCKLGEAALAGKAVITTRLGAVGYPQELRDAFVVVDDAGSLNRQVVTNAIERLSPESIRAQFDAVVGCAAAARTYAGVLDSVADETPSGV